MPGKRKTKALPVLPRATGPSLKKSAFAPLPKRAGVMTPKKMNKYLDDLTKLRARNDHRVAQNAEDHLLRGYAATHMHSQGHALANNWHLAFFPGLADLPLPRPPHA